MKIFKLIIIIATGMWSLCSCEQVATPYLDQTDSKAGASVYIARFTGLNQNLVTFPFIDEERTFLFSASFGALGLSSKDIKMKFEIDLKALDSINEYRAKSQMPPYLIFPEGAYRFDALESVIKAGKLSSDNVVLSYKSKMFDPELDYMLPISIKDADGYAIGKNKTIFITIPKLAEVPIAKTNWTIAANSEELVGEGASNGKAMYAIDNNIQSYWHSKWQAPADTFPHWLHIDMKEEQYVTRVDLAARQNTTNGFRKFDLQASKDGISWTSLGEDLTFDPAIKAYQSYPVEHGYWRYIKLVVTAGYTPTMTSTNLAEISIFRY